MALVQATGGASWRARIKEGAYTPPSGTRIVFEFADVERSLDPRNTLFQFPGVDGGYVQRNGRGPNTYPLRCFFTGDSCDLEATAFEEALLESGIGKLEHPFYGAFPAVAFGAVRRRDDLVSAANQAIIDVTFLPTLRAVYPTSQGNPQSEITAALAGFDVAAAQGFDDLTNLKDLVSQAQLKPTINEALGQISKSLNAISDATASVSREFRDVEATISNSLDVLIGQPLALAQQMITLTTLPARAAANIRARLAAYGDLFLEIIGSKAGRPEDELLPSAVIPSRTRRVANAFHTADLVAMSATAGPVVAALDTTFRSRPDAIFAAAAIFDIFDALVVWRDDAFTTLGGASTSQLDPGGAYQALQNAVALVAGHLIQVSFELVPEQSLTLDRPRTVIDVAAEVYQSVADDTLNLIINDNDLTGSEILELPAGKTIVYYPNANGQA
jgi:hypothetical protein